ncbi:MAG TPA: hypothetical protein VNZ01_13105 [Solirubrobacteraceae bacterium]|jgi:hypothetical protein|nr:hypothetical protein [Solirubrobacteraceae bacterium]
MARQLIALMLGDGRTVRVRSVGAVLTLVLALATLCGSSASAATSGTAENENGVVTATCTSLSITYRNFPNAPNNTVTQTITIHGAGVSKKKIVFNGPTGTNTMSIVVPPGSGNVDDQASWNTNGFIGHFDLGVPLECPANPDFSIVKLQKIEGSKTGFTSAPLTGKIGQTVDYEIIVKNTGNVPETFTNFTDANCGPVSGGPGAAPVETGNSTTYTCSHVLTEVGSYGNSATDTANAPPRYGVPPITHSSNTVVVNVPADPGFSIAKLQEIAGSNAGFTESPLTGEVGQTVNYEIVVTNTGNVPLTFGELTDEKCESVTGGPGETAVAPGASTTYFCHHLLTEAKAYSNTATVTGTPPLGDGPPITHTSNPVVVVTNPAEKGTEEGENGVVTATCSYVRVTYRGFPNLPNNTVTQTITIHGAAVSKTKFTFNGPTGTDIVAIVVPPGAGFVDVHATWSTNGFSGHFDIGVSIECPPEPDFSITKLQEIAGSNTGFTTSPLTGEVGQTVEYEIVVKNTGNVPLTFSNFTDERCGAVTGGPGTSKLALRASTIYRCSHLLSELGSYSNSATDTGQRAPASGPTVTHTSNTVVVNVTK